MREIFFTILIFTATNALGQTPIDIAESTLKVGGLGEEVFYYGFAEGDKMIFSFSEANGKELKEVEIIEMPSTSRFMDYKTKKTENKIIVIPRTAIYKFRFMNSTILPRVCKYKIQRIPAGPATQNFNTTVFTHTVNDTSYTTEQENYIDNSDTVLTNLQDRVVKIQTGGGKSVLNFILPENTIEWSYYIYSDEAGKKVYEEAVKMLANDVLARYARYDPLGAELFNIPSHLKKLQTGKPINFWVVENENADLFMKGEQFRFIKKGTIVNDYSRMNFRKGSLYLCFSTTNSPEPASITVKIASLHINEVLKTRETKRILSISPKTKMYLKN